MKKIRMSLAVLALVLGIGPLAGYGQSGGGNTGPSGGGGTGSSPTGAGGESAASGLPPGPGTSGQGNTQGAASATPGAAGSDTNANHGAYPPTGATPTTTEPPSPHAGGPISPSS